VQPGGGQLDATILRRLHAGNMGHKQGLDNLLDTARHLQSDGGEGGIRTREGD
jgi:hypothetical protein